MKNQVEYNKVVNFDEDTKEITVLDYIFNNGDFKGATGSKFEAISREQYEETTEEENVIDYLIDSGIELDDRFKRGGFQSMYNQMYENDELKDCMFDCSYSELWNYLREELGLSEDEAFIFNCIGGGRCFDSDFEGNVNPELSILIREVESK